MDVPFTKNLLAVGVLMASMSSFAADYTVSTPETGPLDVSAYDSVTVTQTGSVDCIDCGDSAVVITDRDFGSISNAGTIAVTDIEAWADAISIDVGATVAGGILNDTTGVIFRDASSCDEDPYCLGGGIGVYASGKVSGGITNNGSIDTTTNGLANARDAGILLMSVQGANGTLQGSPTVTGNITNTGSITSDYAAIYVAGATVNGDIVNSGTLEGGRGLLISSEAAEVGSDGLEQVLEAADSAAAAVINGSIVNSGTITGTGADGLTLDGNVTITGDIINTGTIASNVARGSESFAAIWLGDDSKGGVKIGGSIINSGVLLADSYASDADERRGVITINGAHSVSGIVNQAGGEIDNLASTDHGDAYAIWVDDSASVGFITNSGTIYGDIDFGANGGVFNALGGTNDAVYNATRINIRSNGQTGATVSRFYDEKPFVYSGVLGVDAFGSANGLAYGQLEVGRGADLRGTRVDVNVTGDNFINDGDSFTFLKAATGGISGDTLQSDITTATDNSAVLDFSVKQVDNTLVATAKRAAFAVVAQPAGTGGSGGAANTFAVAGALDSVVNALGSGQVDVDSELGQMVNALSAIGTGEELAAAIQTLQPETVSGSMTGSSAAGNAAAGTVNNRQASLRSLGAYGESGMVAGGDVARNGFWLKGYGSLADQDRRGGISGYEADTAGLALGFDVPLSANFNAGLAFIYGNTEVTSDNKNTVDIDSYQLSAYGSYNASEYFVDGMVSYAQNTYDSRRTLFNGLVAKGDHDGQQYDLRVRAGYPLAISEALRITPQLTAQYTYLDEDSYSEKGAGNAGLTISPDDNEAFILGASVEMAYSLTDSAQNTWVPSLNLGVFEDLIGDEAEFNSSFVGVPASAFSTRGIDVETTSYVVGVGLRVFGQGNLDVSVNYDYVTRSGYESQNLQATVRWAF